jgi:UbiD family decarboxylase
MPKNLHSFLKEYEANYPDDVLNIEKEIDSNQEITAIIIHLEKLDKYPLLVFHNVLNAEGKRSEQPVVTNVLASRTREARICNSTYETLGKDVYEATRTRRKSPITVTKEQAPVKQVINIGGKINLMEFPALVHNSMDAGPYFSAGFLTTYDPDSGIDNCSLVRGWIMDKDTIRSYITPRPAHNAWNLYKHEIKNQNMKVAYWSGHHPLAYIGGLTKLPYPGSHWEAIGGILDEPLRLVPSESLGDDFLIPADAEIVVEGILEAGKRYAEGPFGENPRYVGPQIVNPQWKVTAITHRKDAMWYSVAAGYVDHPGTGSALLEGLLYDYLKPRFPSLQRIYMPLSALGRFHAYLQFKNPAPGEARQAIMMALSARSDHIKHIFCFDDDIDIFNPREVMWAIATRSQWNKDLMVFPQTKSIGLDPSLSIEEVGSAGGIDCTKPWGVPYEEKVGIEPEVLEKVSLDDFVSPKAIARIKPERI